MNTEKNNSFKISNGIKLGILADIEKYNQQFNSNWALKRKRPRKNIPIYTGKRKNAFRIMNNVLGDKERVDDIFYNLAID